jgi:riboflavin kinase / FMN adenylyltransferase
MFVHRISARHAPPSANIALTIGNFDGVHLGHQAMLRALIEAANARALTPCVMSFEPHPRELFDPANAPARLSTLREKLLLLRAHGIARAFVCRFDAHFADLAPEAFASLVFDRLGARWLLVGDDFRFGRKRSGDAQQLIEHARSRGAQVERMASVQVGARRVSSTAVREALARGDLALARDWLGRAYRIAGRVAHGQKLGRQLGFPTANVLLKRARAPLAGIFAVRLFIGEHSQGIEGAASIGVRPTVSDALLPTLEVHLFDFQRDIYGAHVQVEFHQKLRDEEKYPNLEALRAQIALDVANARAYFREHP